MANTRDPFWLEISSELDRVSDGNLFEASVCRLLRDAYPSLVPITGGSDAGMDGAIAAESGDPLPLVVTIQKDVIGNFSRNLKKHREHSDQQKVVVATSQKLTPRRIRNLYQRAGELGYQLVQVHPHEDLVNRLYGNPEICRDLLGLHGAPPALSSIPPNQRTPVSTTLIGREKDIEWLTTTAGDKLVVGQPGVGKTRLLEELANQGRLFFLRGTDEGEIAGAIRKFRPGAIAVDDAHAHRKQLDLLIDLRRQNQADFSIVASTWPAAEDDLRDRLGLASSQQVRKLEGLPRRDIVEILRQVCRDANDVALTVLADQSRNRPGLAAMLGGLWNSGAIEDIATGEALRIRTTAFVRELVGARAVRSLAHISLGGDSGLSLEELARTVGSSVADVHDDLAGLDAAGALEEVRSGVFSVWPRELRFSLVRNLIDQKPRLGIRKALESVERPSTALHVIVGAYRRGATVDRRELLDLLRQYGTPRTWAGFAENGAWEGERALEACPNDLLALATSTLKTVPERTILELLAWAARSDSSETLEMVEKALRTWVQGTRSSDQALSRRRTLASAVAQWAAKNDLRRLSFTIALIAIDPVLERTTESPVGDSIRIERGLLDWRALERISDELWPAHLKDLLSPVGEDEFLSLRDSLWPWIYPSYGAAFGPVPDDARPVMHEFARRVLRDLQPDQAAPAGLRSGFVRLAGHVDLDLDVSEDPVFKLLFPAEASTQEEEQASQEAAMPALLDLAAEWSGRPANDIARDLARLSRDATMISHPRWPPNHVQLCELIANRAASPLAIARELVESNAPGELLQPFLDRGLDSGEVDIEALASLLTKPHHRTRAALALLKREGVPKDITERAIEVLSDFPLSVETAVIRGELSEESALSCLQATDTSIALATAVGLWHRRGKKTAEAALTHEWKSAILRSASTRSADRGPFDYWIANILAGDPEIASQWLVEVSRDDSAFPTRIGRTIDAAVSALDGEQRSRLLSSLPDTTIGGRITSALVAKNPTLYRDLLEQQPRGQDRFLTPLGFEPDGDWLALAAVALDAGLEPKAILLESFFPTIGGWSWGGDEVLRWQQRRDFFENLRSGADQEFTPLVQPAVEIIEENIREAEGRHRARELQSFR